MNEILLSVGNASSLKINRREAARYLGLRGTPDADVLALFDPCEQELRALAVPRACFAKTAVALSGDRVIFDFCSIESAALAKNLAGCKSAFVFAATLGLGVDRMLLRLNKTDPVQAAVFDALSSAAVEGWCNEVNAELSRNMKTSPRFSPGYGGVDLSVQRDVLAFLDAQRKLGITLSDRCFMTPVKSVTAFIGIKEETE